MRFLRIPPIHLILFFPKGSRVRQLYEQSLRALGMDESNSVRTFIHFPDDLEALAFKFTHKLFKILTKYGDIRRYDEARLLNFS
jgi:hypothetical protein